MSTSSSNRRKIVMNTPKRLALASLSLAPFLALLAGCFVSNPCDAGYAENSQLQCEAIPPPPEAAAPEASASTDGGAGD